MCIILCMEEIEMSSRKTTIIGASAVIIVLAVILITGRKSINVVNGVNGYSDENSIYNQANLILGEEQVYGGAGKIITEVANDGQIYNVAFNVTRRSLIWHAPSRDVYIINRTAYQE